MVAVFKPKCEILIFWAEWLIDQKVNYGTSLVYCESTATDCEKTKS